MRFFGSNRATSRRVRAALVAAVLAGGGAAGVALAQNVGDTVWVERQSVQLRQGAGAGYSVVAEVKRTAELKVLARNGKWLQVQTSTGQQGWVLETSLSVKKISGGSGLGGLVSSDPAEMGVAAAGKGLEQQALDLAIERNQKPELVDGMIAERQAAAADWDQFMKEGAIGVYKKQ